MLTQLEDIVPPGYWTALVEEIKSWKDLPEPEIDYPEED